MSRNTVTLDSDCLRECWITLLLPHLPGLQLAALQRSCRSMARLVEQFKHQALAHPSCSQATSTSHNSLPILARQKPELSFHHARKQLQNDIFEWASSQATNNTVTRQLQASCQDLAEFDATTPQGQTSFRLPRDRRFHCYGCSKKCRSTHPVYVFCCHECGRRFQLNRHLSTDLSDHVALVTGARTKLGHQIVVKLLKAGASVIGTTRYPQDAIALYQRYKEWPAWQSKLSIYPECFDLDIPSISEAAARLSQFAADKFGKLDILVNCAAQTIRVREKVPKLANACNRYGDAKFVEAGAAVNSWSMRLGDLVQPEMEEVYRINAIGPCLMVQQLAGLMKKSSHNPYIINVHAREGLFDVGKGDCHLHTNMAKAGLAMLTKCLKGSRLRTDSGKLFWIHGCDPGWISVDEYYEAGRPWNVPPLDEIDGAARILYPVMKRLKGSFAKTRRHFYLMTY
ncbi:hypothetical protein WJX74_001223 [Apatococcus lobatus]|uniref:Uncharacterized protein n=1 Tax=Apatococcus lobatus TaxID=904363 RepID=A0AAW1RFT8_9CHLO